MAGIKDVKIIPAVKALVFMEWWQKLEGGRPGSQGQARSEESSSEKVVQVEGRQHGRRACCGAPTAEKMIRSHSEIRPPGNEREATPPLAVRSRLVDPERGRGLGLRGSIGPDHGMQTL